MCPHICFDIVKVRTVYGRVEGDIWFTENNLMSWKGFIQYLHEYDSLTVHVAKSILIFIPASVKAHVHPATLHDHSPSKDVIVEVTVHLQYIMHT